MSDEMAQLDELTESDIMAALGQDIPEGIQEEVTQEEPQIQESETNEFTEESDTQEHEYLHETPDGEVTNIPDGLLEADDEEDGSEGEELEDLNEIEMLPMAEIESAIEEDEEETITMNSDEAGNLASILSKLLNNKTIEITIKVKD